MQVGGEEERPTMQEAAAAEASMKPSTRSLLEEAGRKKTEGNAFYREKNIRAAIGRYHRALLLLRSLDSEAQLDLEGFGSKRLTLTSEQEKILRDMQVDCFNNIAACLLQRESVDFKRVLEYSLKVLERRPADPKALYRAGVATLKLGDAQKAKQYLTQAYTLQPNDGNIKRYLQMVEEKLSNERLQEKAMYRGMFAARTKSGCGE
ncbi:tetratricopeptide repeat protein 9C [Stigmatopora nigra]